MPLRTGFNEAKLYIVELLFDLTSKGEIVWNPYKILEDHLRISAQYGREAGGSYTKEQATEIIERGYQNCRGRKFCESKCPGNCTRFNNATHIPQTLEYWVEHKGKLYLLTSSGVFIVTDVVQEIEKTNYHFFTSVGEIKADEVNSSRYLSNPITQLVQLVQQGSASKAELTTYEDIVGELGGDTQENG